MKSCKLYYTSYNNYLRNKNDDGANNLNVLWSKLKIERLLISAGCILTIYTVYLYAVLLEAITYSYNKIDYMIQSMKDKHQILRWNG